MDQVVSHTQRIIVSAERKIIGVPAVPAVLNLFGANKQVTFEGNTLALIAHDERNTFLLRQLGFDVPAPILSQYNWRNPQQQPFEIQKKTCELLTLNVRAYVLNSMGTGKTKCPLWAWDHLAASGFADKMLVLAPLSTLNFTWGREIFTTLGPDVKFEVLYGDRNKRLKKLANPDADIYIINHDGLQVIADALLDRPDISTLVVDELGVYRNGGADRTKLVRKIAARMNYVWGMTGSPTPNAPTDAWGEAQVVTPHTVPKYFGRFRDQVMYKVGNFKWLPKPDALETVYKVLQPSVRYTLDDVTELPDVVMRTVDIEMGPKQAKVYALMEKEAHSMVDGHTITAMNAGAVLNKLLQISTGYVYTRDRTIVALDNEARLDALIDHIVASDRKVLVFVPFKHALAGIKNRLTSEGISSAIVSGDTPKGERDIIFNGFQNSAEPTVIAAHPSCMSHGLTLTSADTIIWFAPITSLETFEQANARIRRVGQKHKQLVLMFQATKAEKLIYGKLRSKQKVQNLLLDMFSDGS